MPSRQSNTPTPETMCDQSQPPSCVRRMLGMQSLQCQGQSPPVVQSSLFPIRSCAWHNPRSSRPSPAPLDRPAYLCVRRLEHVARQRASRVWYCFSVWHKRNARYLAVRHLAPLDSLATERGCDYFAKLVVVALVEVFAFAHGFVAGTLGAQRAQNQPAFGGVGWDPLLSWQRSWCRAIRHNFSFCRTSRRTSRSRRPAA